MHRILLVLVNKEFYLNAYEYKAFEQLKFEVHFTVHIILSTLFAFCLVGLYAKKSSTPSIVRYNTSTLLQYTVHVVQCCILVQYNGASFFLLTLCAAKLNLLSEQARLHASS